MSATLVPVWQVLLAISLQIAAIVFIVRSVSRAFRAQTLLSGKSFKLRNFFNVFIKGT